MGKSIYEMVTERIINELENGVIPWQKPWTGGRGGAYNRISRKPYSLINQFILKHPGEYATFNEYSALPEPGVRRVRATIPVGQSQCSGQ